MNHLEIPFSTQEEAEGAKEVLAEMRDLLSEKGKVSIADLAKLIGYNSIPMDARWGWTDLPDSSVVRTDDGYVLNLPRPEPLD